MAATTLEQRRGLTVLAFPAAALGVYGAPLGGARFTPVQPDEVLYAAGATAALIGPMFELCSGQDLPAGPEAARYAASRCDVARFLAYDARRRVAAPSSQPGDGITVGVVAGKTVVVRGGAVPAGARVAVQLYPPLVVEGRSVATGSLNLEHTGRSALVVLPNDRLAFVVGTMPLPDFAARLVDLGAVYAGYTDGGGSTALVAGKTIYGSSERRPAPIWLVVDGAPPGAGKAAWWALGAAAVAGAGYWWKRRSDTQ